MGSGGGEKEDKVASEPTRAGDFAPGKEAGTRTDSRKPKPGVRKREEERLTRAGFVSGDASYVREAPKEGERRGTIIRDSKGRGVLTAKGVERQQASRQEELETLIANRATSTIAPDGTFQTARQDPAAEKRKLALEIINDKLKTAINPISIINLKNQKRRLEAGTADPLFQLTEGGSFTTKGVVDRDEPGGGEVVPSIPAIDPDDERAEQPQAPVIDDQEDDEEEQTILGRGRSPAQRRRTRSTRVGGAGTFETGYGALLRGPRVTAPGSGGLNRT